jgi:hypothetical protein
MRFSNVTFSLSFSVVAPHLFNAELDPAFFYRNADPDPDPGTQTNADPYPGQTWLSQKVEFLYENILNVGS